MTLSMQQQQQQQLLQQQQRQQRQQISSSAAASASNSTMPSASYTTANANAPYKPPNPLATSSINPAPNAPNNIIPVSHPKSSTYQPPSSQPLSAAGSRHSVSFADEVTGVPFPGIRFRNPQALQQLMAQNPSMSRHSYSPYATSALSAAPDSRVIGPPSGRQSVVPALYEYRQGAVTPTPMSNGAGGGAPTLAYISSGPSATDPRVVPMQWHPQQYTVQRHPVIRPGLTAPQKQITIRGGIAYETPVGLPFGRPGQSATAQQQQPRVAGSPYVDTIVPQASQLNRAALLQQQVIF